MLWVYTWHIWGTSYFLAYSCELFVVERVNVIDKKAVSVNLFLAILGFFPIFKIDLLTCILNLIQMVLFV